MIDLSTLPAPVVEALRTAFGDQTPAGLEPVSGGFSTATLLKATVAGRPYVVRQVRLDDPVQDRVRQFRCLALAAERGIAPPLIHADPARGVCILEFVESTPFVAALGSGDAVLEQLARTVRKLHEGPAFPPFVSLATAVAGMQDNLVRLGVAVPSGSELVTLAAEIETALAPHVVAGPCHHDLNPGNVLVGSTQLWLVDWELAGQGDPYDDLAGFGVFSLRTPERRALFLRAYLGRDPTRIEQARMILARVRALAFYASGFFNAALARRLTTEAPADEVVPDLASAMAEMATRPGVGPTSEPARFGRILTQETLREASAPAFAEALASLR